MSIDVRRQEIRSVTSPLQSRRLDRRWIATPLIVFDALCIAFSMIAAYQLRFNILSYQAVYSPLFYTRLAMIATFSWGIIFAFYGLYNQENLFGGFKEYVGVVNGCTLGLVGLVIYSFLDRTNYYDISRGWLAMVWVLTISSVGLTRSLYRWVIYRARARGAFGRRVLIVGANEEGTQVAAQLQDSPSAGIEVVGFVDPHMASGMSVSGVPVVGDPGSLGSLIRKLDVEEVIIIPSAVDHDTLLGIYRDWGTSDQIQIHLSSGLYELFTTGVQVNQAGFVPLLRINRTRITGIDLWLKTALDYVIASTALVMLSPLFLLLALWIRRDSPGNVVYRRRVVGLHGHVFDAFKFRTMVSDAEACLDACPELKEEWETTGKIQNDPRITGVGRVLRRFSLDELPQLVNVLRGEMSLVGPRMITPGELRHFGRWQHNLFTVKPGLTGLWQVSGRSDIAYEERVRLDMYYIRNHTIWMDLKLLVNTVSTVLTGRGAY